MQYSSFKCLQPMLVPPPHLACTRPEEHQEQEACSVCVFFPLTFMGALPVMLATRKFMAISSQFMCASTQFLMSPGILYVYK